MKIFKFTLATAITALLFIVYSCQQESVLDTTADLPYLSLPENADFNNLSDDEKEIICMAYPRMGIHENKDGLFELTVRSGHQVNVSENIYMYYVKMIDDSNDYYFSNLIISRSDLLDNSESSSMQTNCMAYAISYATKRPFVEVNQALADAYPDYSTNGIHMDQFYNAAEMFNGPSGGKRIDKTEFNNYITQNFNGKCIVEILDMTGRHAINAYNIYQGGFWGKDYQRSADDYGRVYPYESIVAMYLYY
ncbi:MAG: hypothetical protein NC127_05295 [Muribaculum sp.]|nr:hypothetical protein [Muribaculum sp.]